MIENLPVGSYVVVTDSSNWINVENWKVYKDKVWEVLPPIGPYWDSIPRIERFDEQGISLGWAEATTRRFKVVCLPFEFEDIETDISSIGKRTVEDVNTKII